MNFLRFLIALCFASTAASCGQEVNGEQQTVIAKDSSENNSLSAENDVLPYDTLLTDMSKLIAGLPVESYFKDIQEKAFYSEHKTFTDTSWKLTRSSMLDPIAAWTKEKNIGDDRDSVLCFYPLSGPDFLFGNAFFPDADNYVMLGLEPKGSLTDFRKMNDDALVKYFEGMRASMKYLNTRGYFVTSHMSKDFNRYYLNGMVHMILYMMAKTNHKIIAVKNIYLDQKGAVRDTPKFPPGAITAVNITYLSPDQKEKRNAYYFSLNASDKYLTEHPEFKLFVNSFPRRVSYMKSASCVLQNTPFSIMRELVLGSDKVLQDDTGVPYKYFVKQGDFDIQLHGTYSSVIKDLSWCLQKDLKKDLDSSDFHGDLPFRISYNGNYGEGMLLYAVKKKK